MIRVLVADDHPIVREGIKHILEADHNIVVASEAGTADEAVASARQGGFDLMLLDLKMPGADGFDLLDSLRRLTPATPILVLSMHKEDEYGVRCLQLGASGYVPKISAPETLAKAVHKVAAGGKYVSEALAERLASLAGSRRTEAGPPHLTLGTREYQVLLALAGGKTLRAAAAELGISQNTVNSYWSRIKAKLGVHNRAELIEYTRSHRLADEELN